MGGCKPAYCECLAQPLVDRGVWITRSLEACDDIVLLAKKWTLLLDLEMLRFFL